MIARKILLGFGFAFALAGSAQAACSESANGTKEELAQAQRLARFSESGTVRTAYANDKCDIRNVVHKGGAPCPQTKVYDHATVDVDKVSGAFHVFTVQTDGGWCTTH